MNKLKELHPQRVFHYFEEICAIPHGSGNTQEISDYCVEFAKKHNLFYIKEEIGNVIIKKGGTKGKENKPPVILQGHLDMVCEKENGTAFDFTKDSLNIDFDCDYIFANNTTLGADNGIAVAMCLAILESNKISHPPLEVLFTVDEETGMYGAKALNGRNLLGRRLINIDSEEEGVFTVSCAGGARAELKVPIVLEANTDPCYKITIGGLKGGHSGIEIHKNRYNSNKLAAELLKEFKDYRLVCINGGLKDNAIPSHTEIVIACNKDYSKVTEKFLSKKANDIDGGLYIKITKADKQSIAFTKKSTKDTVDFLLSVPNGIIGWSKDIENLVETSLNLGVLKSNNTEISASFAVRSSKNNEKTKLIQTLEEYVKKFGGNLTQEGHYPAWEYRKESELCKTMERVYEEFCGTKPKIAAIHAGLECGMLSEKLNELDAVSIGPNMFEVHTPKEKLSISSTRRVYNYLIKLLEKL